MHSILYIKPELKQIDSVFGRVEEKKMVYKNGFVAVVKDNSGHVLRDSGNKVLLPFYEEYSLLLKNQHGVRAVATVEIDGENVMGGREAVIEAHGEFPLERYIKNLDKGRKFQFVPLKDSRIKYKADHPDLGIIEISFRKENKHNLIDDWSGPEIKLDLYTRRMGSSMSYTSNTADSSEFGTVSLGKARSGGQSVCRAMKTRSGGTAHGSRSTQSFGTTTIGDLESDSTIIRLRLVPSDYDEPNTVKNTKKIYCVSCGKKNPRTANYCSQCGNKIIT